MRKKGDHQARARTEAGVPRRPQTIVSPEAAPIEEGPSPGKPLTKKEVLAVAFVTLLALIVRVILLPAAGHTTDVATFESWMNTILKVGPKDFYGTAGFVDYPPGYMLVLWAVGGLYHATAAYGDFTGAAMRIFVKMPAVIADLGIGYLVYLIARRNWSVASAIVAMAVFALNPASWLVSAFWGQADSVAAVFLIWALYLAVTKRFAFAWLALAFAVLIKPQPLVIAPLILIWQLREQGWSWRLALAPLMGGIVGYLGSLPFAPTANPAAVLVWLYDRYHDGIGVYPYNSVNALNLYSINRDFFQPDTQPIAFFGLQLGPQYYWGMAIFLALAIAVGWRLWRVLRTSDDASARELTFYTACFVVALGFYMVVTRQHERYLFTALAIAPLLWNASPVMRVATVVLSATFSYNLFYALAYLANPGPDLYPLIVHPLSLINFATLVLVAGAFLIDEVGEWANAKLSPFERKGVAAELRLARKGPNPFEGLVGMTLRDYAIAGALMIGTGVLLFWGITNPKERYFDEIYYARAAQEYLTHQNLYEWTHPPLTKLIMTFGAWLFGPPRGPYVDPIGARMGNALMGTLTVPFLYAFAKRLFASTAACVVAVVLLVTSGYFYVQARIATPEISVAFFSMLALYCFYRYWTSSQIVKVRRKPSYPLVETGIAAFGVLLALVISIYAQVAVYNAQAWGSTVIPYIVALVVFGGSVAFWSMSWRRAAQAPARVIYPDGSYVDGQSVVFPSGETRPLKTSIVQDGDTTYTWRADGVDVVEGENRVTWRADGTIEGIVEGQRVNERQRWGLWLALSALALAAFIASKWNGLFGLAALWFVAVLVYAQPFLTSMRRAKRPEPNEAPRRFAWGNPVGVRLPLYFAASIVTLLAFYVLTYVPNWTGAISTGTAMINQGGFSGLLSLQYQMYHYHATLTATHLYSSKWWTWPLELRPVSYYYKAISGVTPPNQIVAEIVSLPNPAVWWAGLVTVPWAGVLAWRERHRGVLLLIIAYLWLWLPWSMSPRIDFMYNFFPNLAVICLCTTYVLLTLWRRAVAAGDVSKTWAAIGIGGYLALCVALFIYFMPILNGSPITWTQWDSRMWIQGPIEHGWI